MSKRIKPYDMNYCNEISLPECTVICLLSKRAYIQDSEEPLKKALLQINRKPMTRRRQFNLISSVRLEYQVLVTGFSV